MQQVTACRDPDAGRPPAPVSGARQLLVPSVWARGFERAATTAAVLVISAAEVTQRYTPETRTAALAGLWSGLVALAGLCWAAAAAVAGLAKLRRRVVTRHRPVCGRGGGGTKKRSPAPPHDGIRRVAIGEALRALLLAMLGAGVLWSRTVLVSAWLPLCVGLVEALAVLVAYRLLLAYRLATAHLEGERP